MILASGEVLVLISIEPLTSYLIHRYIGEKERVPTTKKTYKERHTKAK